MDHLGALRGKRLPFDGYASALDGHPVPFCDAALAWDHGSVVHDDLSLSGAASGYGDVFAQPDAATLRALPWSSSTAHALADLVDHHGEFIASAPRHVLSRAIDALGALGYEARIGIELEFYLQTPTGEPLGEFQQCYSIDAVNALEPAIGEIVRGLEGFVDVEAVNAEYGPGQLEINLRHKPALEAADQAVRFRYAVRELARRNGVRATFLAKPYNGFSGSSMHAHVSLWQDGRPAFSPAEGHENPAMRRALGGVLSHLDGIALYGAPTVNSYRRFEPGSFAPTTATWGGDNRTASVRSLVESPEATRLELRTGGADANPYWLAAGLLAAIAAGIAADADPGERGSGDLYQSGAPLPTSLVDAVDAAIADDAVSDILGADAVRDYAAIAAAEWRAFITTVTAWDHERYGGVL